MLQCVYERVALSSLVNKILIATDDSRIHDAARSFGAEAMMTRPDHSTGTERVAEAAAAQTAEIVVNVQGDEPLIDPAAIDSAILPLLAGDPAPMSTLMKRICDPRDLFDPNVVKVVTDGTGNAIYFSRSLIPFPRDAAAAGNSAGAIPDALPKGIHHFRHIGLYVYRREFLLDYSRLPVGPLERSEKLEQLRALENGFKIRVVETEYDAIGVDTPDDLERVREQVGAGEV
jgi:3-deoxy-manno-octulosonate cytidylyltransferase (CMP-KDO synthetase)